MEFLPNETHRLFFVWDAPKMKFTACVDGRMNTWRINPEDVTNPRERAYIEQEIAEMVAYVISRKGYRPAWVPFHRMQTPAVYAAQIWPGTRVDGEYNFDFGPPPRPGVKFR